MFWIVTCFERLSRTFFSRKEIAYLPCWPRMVVMLNMLLVKKKMCTLCQRNWRLAKEAVCTSPTLQPIERWLQSKPTFNFSTYACSLQFSLKFNVTVNYVSPHLHVEVPFLPALKMLFFTNFCIGCLQLSYVVDELALEQVSPQVCRLSFFYSFIFIFIFKDYLGKYISQPTWIIGSLPYTEL